MAFTQADLDAFDAELKSRGTVTAITFSDGQSQSFSSLEDAMKFRAWLASVIPGATGIAPKNIRYAVTSKGA